MEPSQIAISFAGVLFLVSVLIVAYKAVTVTKKDLEELRRLHHEANLALETAIANSTEVFERGVDVIEGVRATDLTLVEVEPEPFVTFPCLCGVQLSLAEQLDPGQAAVINCDNCQTSHSIYLPSVQIHPTEKFDLVWPFTKNEGVNK